MYAFKEELKDAYAEIKRLRAALEDIIPFAEYQLAEMRKRPNCVPLAEALQSARAALGAHEDAEDVAIYDARKAELEAPQGRMAKPAENKPANRRMGVKEALSALIEEDGKLIFETPKDATANRGEQRTICEDCGNSNLAHDRAVWTDDGASYCPTCRKIETPKPPEAT